MGAAEGSNLFGQVKEERGRKGDDLK
jgi:hypothetical protein